MCVSFNNNPAEQNKQKFMEKLWYRYSKIIIRWIEKKSKKILWKSQKMQYWNKINKIKNRQTQHTSEKDKQYNNRRTFRLRTKFKVRKNEEILSQQKQRNPIHNN